MFPYFVYGAIAMTSIFEDRDMSKPHVMYICHYVASSKLFHIGLTAVVSATIPVRQIASFSYGIKRF